MGALLSFAETILQIGEDRFPGADTAFKRQIMNVERLPFSKCALPPLFDEILTHTG